MDKVRAVCIWSGFRQIGEKKTPTISLRFKILDGAPEFGMEEVDGDLWLTTDKACERTISTLGGVFGYFGAVHDFCDHHDLLNGIEVILVGEYETYNGKERWKVKFINSPGDEGWAPSTDEDRAAAKKLDGMLRGKILAFQQKVQQGQAAKAAAQGGAPAPAKAASAPAAKATAKSPVQASSGTINWADVKPKPAPKSAAEPEAPPVEAYGEGPTGTDGDGDGLPF